mmetsp:Transcript_18867/g.21618  ORF Transcript_18867/g.21618 Transcript_18867/m.21618 type:complete len:135 (+) Transcript_18867:98-502(+)
MFLNNNNHYQNCNGAKNGETEGWFEHLQNVAMEGRDMQERLQNELSEAAKKIETLEKKLSEMSKNHEKHLLEVAAQIEDVTEKHQAVVHDLHRKVDSMKENHQSEMEALIIHQRDVAIKMKKQADEQMASQSWY